MDHQQQQHFSKSKLYLENQLCRFCYEPCEEGVKDGSLIAPCYCKGSMKHIHQKCLKNWIKF